jgi:hypothetical protein
MEIIGSNLPAGAANFLNSSLQFQGLDPGSGRIYGESVAAA